METAENSWGLLERKKSWMLPSFDPHFPFFLSMYTVVEIIPEDNMVNAHVGY